MKKIMILLLTCITMSTYAQVPAEMIKKFFTTYQTDPGKAILDIHKTNKWNETRVQSVINTKTLVESFKKQMGDYFGYELLEVVKSGISYEKHSYIVKYDQHPLVFNFTFYKPNDTWVLYVYNIDSSLMDVVKDKGASTPAVTK